MKLTFSGSTETVTGSQYLIESEGKKYLIDFGLYQGPDPISKLNRREFPWNPSQINALFLTHAHIDHSGMIPWLIKKGFKGLIHSTNETFELCKILLLDSGKIQNEEYKRALKNNPKAQLPLYTEEEASQALDRFIIHEFNKPFNIDHLKVTYTPAGHIPGASSVQIVSPQSSILFSGDLGRTDDILMNPPDAPPKSDYVVMETTYGDRQHDPTPPLEELEFYVKEVIKNQSKLIVPTFALARAQLLIQLFKVLFEKNPELKIPFVVHSPMTEKVTQLYKDFSSCLKISKKEVENWDEAARFIHWKNESESIDRKSGPAIIMGASGMVSGGKIIDHIKALGDDPKNIILLTGYQAEGTPGKEILEGKTHLKISGMKVRIQASVHQLKSLSAHADSHGLHQWIDSMGSKPKKVFLSHGEEDGRQGFLEVLSKDDYNVEVPKLDATYNLI
ncbi:MAG: MBL fold metallo-hydrolase [Bacteriovoracaceae bacterium]|nr:MBL fold metallo-hydrolase [Bacteriovoracaceae bacterium]